MSWLRKRKETEHRHFEEQLSAYMDGELLPRERDAFEQHLATCPACRWSLNTLRQTVQWTSELPTVRVPRAFTIPAPAQPARAVRRWRFLPALQGATALVALLLFFVIAGDVMLTGFQPVGMHEPEIQTLAVEATVSAEAGVVVEAEAVVETEAVVEAMALATVVVEKEAESLMMQEAPAAEESAAAQEPKVLQAAPAEAATVTAEAEMRATMAPAGMGGGVEDSGEEAVLVPEGDTQAPQPTLTLQAPAVLPAPTALPTLEPAPARAVMPPPSAPVEVDEALSVPSALQESERSYGLRPAILTWVRWGEYVLGVLLILLVGMTIGVMVWRWSRK